MFHPCVFAGIAGMIVGIVEFLYTLEVLTTNHTLVLMATTFAVTVIVATFSQRPVFQVPVSDFQSPVDEIRAKFEDEMKKALNHYIHPTINTAKEVADLIEHWKERNSQLYQKLWKSNLRIVSLKNILKNVLDLAKDYERCLEDISSD